jgi:hypothetical protein
VLAAGQLCYELFGEFLFHQQLPVAAVVCSLSAVLSKKIATWLWHMQCHVLQFEHGYAVDTAELLPSPCRLNRCCFEDLV